MNRRGVLGALATAAGLAATETEAQEATPEAPKPYVPLTGPVFLAREHLHCDCSLSRAAAEWILTKWYLRSGRYDPTPPTELVVGPSDEWLARRLCRPFDPTNPFSGEVIALPGHVLHVVVDPDVVDDGWTWGFR